MLIKVDQWKSLSGFLFNTTLIFQSEDFLINVLIKLLD